MSRFGKWFLAVSLTVGTLFVSTPPASAMWRGGFRGGFRGGIGYYGGWGWGPGWGWGWGPGWYGPAAYGWYGPGFYYGAPAGKIKIVTTDKAADVYVDGGYAGPVAKMKKFSLRPGTHDVEVRDPNGQVLYNQRVEVMRGHTTEINTTMPHAG